MLSGSRPHTRIYDNGLSLVQLTTLAFFVTSTVLPTVYAQTFVRRKCPSVKTETTHGLLFILVDRGCLNIQMTNLNFTTKQSSAMPTKNNWQTWQTVLQIGVNHSVMEKLHRTSEQRNRRKKQCISSCSKI